MALVVWERSYEICQTDVTRYSEQEAGAPLTWSDQDSKGGKPQICLHKELQRVLDENEDRVNHHRTKDIILGDA